MLNHYKLNSFVFEGIYLLNIANTKKYFYIWKEQDKSI